VPQQRWFPQSIIRGTFVDARKEEKATLQPEFWPRTFPTDLLQKHFPHRSRPHSKCDMNATACKSHGMPWFTAKQDPKPRSQTADENSSGSANSIHIRSPSKPLFPTPSSPPPPSHHITLNHNWLHMAAASTDHGRCMRPRWAANNALHAALHPTKHAASSSEQRRRVMLCWLFSETTCGQLPACPSTLAARGIAIMADHARGASYHGQGQLTLPASAALPSTT